MRKPVVTYAFALAALVAAVLLRWLLDPLMGDALPLVTLFGAVAAAVWVGGYRPAVVVDDPRLRGLRLSVHRSRAASLVTSIDVENVVGLLAYLFTCSLIIGFGEAMRVAQARGQRAARAAAGHAAQHRRRGHHDRHRGPRHVPERRRRVADRLDGDGAARPAARRRVPHRQRGDPPAGREPGAPGRFARASSSAWRITPC